MDLKLLKIFLTVAKSGSFSKAAANLAIAQPILSRQIRALESELGIELFYRNGRGVVLTEAGRLFEGHAQTVVDSLAEARSKLDAMRESPSGEVVIGLPPTVGNVLTAPLVKAFRAEFPQVSLGVVEGFSGFVLEWLASGRLDVAVLYSTSPTTSLATDALDDEQLLLFGHAGDSENLGQGTAITGERIAKLPLILPSRLHGLRILVDNEFLHRDLPVRIDYEIDSLPSILDLVEAGMGYTILPYAPMHKLVAGGRVRYWPFVDPVITRRLVLATSSSRISTTVTRRLASMVRQLVSSLRRDGKLSPRPPGETHPGKR